MKAKVASSVDFSLLFPSYQITIWHFLSN
jgi:hypothetical protein